MELSEIKKAMRTDAIVQYGRARYKIDGCVLKYDRKTDEWYYLLELQDLKANSIMSVRMEDVSVLVD